LEKSRKKLEVFRQKVMSRTCRKYSTAAELGMAVMKSLMTEARIRPRTDGAGGPGALRRGYPAGAELSEEPREANEHIEELEREIRDRAILGDEVPQELLAQGDDVCELTVTFLDQNKRHVKEDIKLTWNEIFKVIGPPMYGYILRKRTGYGQTRTFPFQDNLEEHIRAKIIDRVQNRKVKIESSQVDTCILQFKELGLLRFAENKNEDGQVFRGVSLTELGERRLALLSTRRRGPNTVGA
jgi:hypothetical protein